YMNSILNCAGCSVTVGAGAVADRTYNGENHVVGTSSKSLTLGTSDGATSNTVAPSSSYDTFIANTNDSSGSSTDRITLMFTGILIDNISFDYEIFPDGTCSVLNSAHCGALSGGIYANQPDLVFRAGSTGNSNTDPLVTSFGTNGTQYGVTPGGSN